MKSLPSPPPDILTLATALDERHRYWMSLAFTDQVSMKCDIASLQITTDRKEAYLLCNNKRVVRHFGLSDDGILSELPQIDLGLPEHHVVKTMELVRAHDEDYLILSTFFNSKTIIWCLYHPLKGQPHAVCSIANIDGGITGISLAKVQNFYFLGVKKIIGGKYVYFYLPHPDVLLQSEDK